MGKTGHPLRPGKDVDWKVSKSTQFTKIPAYSWNIILTVFIAPEHFRAFQRIREREHFRRRYFGPEKKMDADINSDINAFRRWSALSCGHRQGIPHIFIAYASFTNNPGVFLITDSFVNVSGTIRILRWLCRRHQRLMTIQHVLTGKLWKIAQISSKSCKSNAEAIGKVLGKSWAGASDKPGCGALWTYVYKTPNVL